MITSDAPAATRISAKRDLGWLYVEQGEFEKAVSKFSEERDLAKASENVSDEGYADIALSDTFQLIGRWDDALKAAQESVQLFKTKGLASGQASAEAQLMALYSDRTSPLKDFDKASFYYQDAERLGYGPSLKLDFVEVYLQQQKYAEASSLAQSRLSECSSENNLDCQAGALPPRPPAATMVMHLRRNVMAIRATAVTFLALLAVLPSQGQASHSDSQTLQAILDEIRAIHQEVKVTQTTQILLTELEIQQGVVNRSIQRADEAQMKLNGIRSAEKDAAAELARSKETLEQSTGPKEVRNLTDRIEALKGHAVTLASDEQDLSVSLQTAQQRLKDAQDTLDDIQNQLNAVVKHQTPRTP